MIVSQMANIHIFTMGPGVGKLADKFYMNLRVMTYNLPCPCSTHFPGECRHVRMPVLQWELELSSGLSWIFYTMTKVPS